MGMGRLKLTLADLQADAAARGGRCLSPEVLGSQVKLEWECSSGHRWWATPNKIREGRWCRSCFNRRWGESHLKDLAWVQRLARARGGVCLSPEYLGNGSDHRFRCEKGHEWLTKPATLRHGAWCPVCANKKKGQVVRKNLQWLQEVASARNGVCLSTEYVNVQTPHRFRCEKGHEWEMKPFTITVGKRWCPVCLSNRLNIVDLQEFAEKKGGKCLSIKCLGALQNHEWKCSNPEHETWMATPANVVKRQGGTWCPRCANNGRSRGQEEVFAYIKGLCADAVLNDRSRLVGLHGKKLELDVYVPSQDFALEYNGLYWHSAAAPGFKASGRHQEKAWLCRAAGIRLLAIYEDEWRDPQKQELVKAMIRWRLQRFSGQKLDARKLDLVYLQRNRDFEAFFRRNHLDGHARASGAWALVGGQRQIRMCLSLRHNFSGELEICRLATDYDYSVRGGWSRLLAAVRDRPLVSFSNNRLGWGRIYEGSGFTLVRESLQPGYWYTDFETRIWRTQCMRVNDAAVLAQYPTEAAQALGGVFSQKHFGDSRPLYRIEDYGNRKWLLQQACGTAILRR